MIITHRLPGIARGLLSVSIVIGSLAGAPGASAEQYRYYCDALKVYYPMVTSCEAGWRRVPVASRGLRHPEKPGGPLAEPPLPTPAPRPQVTREEMPSPT
ncbi:MAG: hypothetical protein F8N37_05245, partial [Telmatospirillum sp.]|nr:hypothetical protein [Telmatospirillum sp.]